MQSSAMRPMCILSRKQDKQQRSAATRCIGPNVRGSIRRTDTMCDLCQLPVATLVVQSQSSVVTPVSLQSSRLCMSRRPHCSGSSCVGPSRRMHTATGAAPIRCTVRHPCGTFYSCPTWCDGRTARRRHCEERARHDQLIKCALDKMHTN